MSSIAEMTGIPRPTVIRKLRELEQSGMAVRKRTKAGVFVHMTTKSWEYVRPHVVRLLQLEEQLSTRTHSKPLRPDL